MWSGLIWVAGKILLGRSLDFVRAPPGVHYRHDHGLRLLLVFILQLVYTRLTKFTKDFIIDYREFYGLIHGTLEYMEGFIDQFVY